jgi:2-dehydro-3-deoxy-D-arabinonate dehydratase
MSAEAGRLPSATALARFAAPEGPRLALWHRGESLALRDGDRDLGLDALLALPRAEIDRLVADACAARVVLAVADAPLLAPVESQEVWASGVTYARSKEARMAESETSADAYDQVYGAPRPELFFKSAGWRVVAPGDAVGIRADSSWNVPEPELAVLMNSRGEVVAYACGNDMSSRSIEGENTLYLPQAKVYDRCAALGPAAVLAGPGVDVRDARIALSIERGGAVVFAGETSTAQMVRDAAALCRVVCSSYTLPMGAWLMTGTGLVPPDDFTLAPGDVVRIAVDGIGELVNPVVEVPHSGASAPPRA